ncbi:SgcJ/EcaC family oxidoreductase [Leifsonia sp. 2TAF2]|uniref:YybH family protein n=1 Tax=Leifsonia sp. 2TAF2 TaxID=3233009 RepID=UPI003F9984D4
MTDRIAVLEEILHDWAESIRTHHADVVAAAFTTDAVFQGFDRTHAVGRAGIAAYYEKQPLGLTAAYRVLETRAIGEEAFVAFVDVDFTRPDGEVIPTHLTLVVVRDQGEWLIQQYHVSKIAA